MAKDLRAVGADFLETAPSRTQRRATLAAAPAAVFAAFATDPAGWGEWFPGFSRTGRWLTPAPHGVDSEREMRLGGNPLVETIIAWEEPGHWAFRVSRGTLPGVRAMAEGYRFTPAGSGTELTWSLGLDVAPAMRPLAGAVGATAGSLVLRAARKLDQRLAATGPAV